MRIEQERLARGGVVIRTAGVVAVAAAQRLRATLTEVLGGGEPCVLDVSQVLAIDTIGAAAIIGAARQARQAGLPFVVAGENEEVDALLWLANGQSVVARRADVATALEPPGS
ncbi:MAG: STAS domain-containing protein [Gemmatimonadales bacterium]|nr:STAS domain-containing protein [Gemmatimonadales bacterium]